MKINNRQGQKKEATIKAASKNLHRSDAEPYAQKQSIEDCRPMRLGGSNGIFQRSLTKSKIANHTSSAKNKLKKFFNGDYRVKPKNRTWGCVLNWFGRLLSLHCKGQSYYNYFNTPKGILDFRLSNHNAHPKNFKERGGDINISVYVVYVGKLLKGGENLTLETICKIQKATGEVLVTVAKPYMSSTPKN